MYWKRSRTASIASFSLNSLFCAPISSTSVPTRSRLAGATVKNSSSVGTRIWSMRTSPAITPYVSPPGFGLSPRPFVDEAWGSMSTRSVGLSAIASAAARLTAVVVLPTPPF